MADLPVQSNPAPLMLAALAVPVMGGSYWAYSKMKKDEGSFSAPIGGFVGALIGLGLAVNTKKSLWKGALTGYAVGVAAKRVWEFVED